MFWALLTTVLWSASAVCATRTTRVMGGTEANFWRLLFAGFLLAAYAHLFGAGLGGGAFHLFLLSGFVGFGIGDVALFQTLPRLGSRVTVLIVQCLAAPMAALTEWLWLGTTLSAKEILCGSVILAGVAIAVAPGGHLNISRRQFVTGLLFGLVAAYGQGLGAVISRRANEVAALSGGPGVDGITAAYQRLIGGLVVTGVLVLIVKRREVFGRLTGESPAETARAAHRQSWAKAWPWLVVNGLSGPALGVSCYQWALKTTPTGIVLPIVAITPLVVIPFTRYMEGERPTLRSLLGGAVAVGGAVALAVLK